jgi:hypothetical protein
MPQPPEKKLSLAVTETLFADTVTKDIPIFNNL